MEGPDLRWEEGEFQRQGAKDTIPHGHEECVEYVEQCGLVGTGRVWGLMEGDDVTVIGGSVTVESSVSQEEDIQIDSVAERKPVELREYGSDVGE